MGLILRKSKVSQLHKPRLMMERAVPPRQFDWRNYKGGNYVTPVKAQKGCGGCWAFATAAAAESYRLIHENRPWNLWNIDLSEQSLISCSSAGNCEGGYMDSASDHIQYHGLLDEQCLSYSESNGSCFANACSDYRINTNRIGGWFYVDSDVNAVKSSLRQYGPLVSSMTIYEDFYKYYRSGVYEYALGASLGSHAILIVGYDDRNQCFISKNSWGADWGEDGYFEIAYSQMNNQVRFGEEIIAYSPDKPGSCAFDIWPQKKVSPVSGGEGSFELYASGGCEWDIGSDGSWIRIDQSGTIIDRSAKYHLTANRSGSERSGKIYVKDSDGSIVAAFSVEQDYRVSSVDTPG